MKEWISTKRRTPNEEGQLVIVAILHDPSNAKWYYNVREAYYKKGDWWDGTHHLITPNYWMQFPEPPLLPDKKDVLWNKAYPKEAMD